MKRFSVCLALLLSFGQGAALAQVRTQPKIAEGYYPGGWEWGIEVRGNRFQYGDEAGRSDWRPITELVPVKPGIVYWKHGSSSDYSYYCHTKIVQPTNKRGWHICTKDGWRDIGRS